MTQLEIQGLWTYPVKSMGGIALDEAQAQVPGFAYDRQWMVITPNGDFVTQRKKPLMASISTALTPDALVIGADRPDAVSIPLLIEEGDLARFKQVRVFSHSCWGVDAGDFVSQWLTDLLGPVKGQPLRLVGFPSSRPRPVSPTHLQGEASHTRYADGYPYLLVNSASLGKLNEQLAAAGSEQVDITRFRANIIVMGGDPYAENQWRELRLLDQSLRFGIRKPCQRCKVITVDQRSGTIPEPGQPLAMLVARNPFNGERKGAYFGQNLTLLDGENSLMRTGDRFEVLS
jgi:uncharacterized protein YcbX